MDKAKKKKYISILIHLTSWFLASGIPFMLFWRGNESDFLAKLIHHSVFVLALVTVYYLNYFVIINKLMFRKRMWEFTLVNLLLILVVGQLIYQWDMLNLPTFDSTPPDGRHNPKLPFALFYFFKYVIAYIFPLGVCIAVKTTGKWYTMEAEMQEEEKKRTEAELTNLRQQLNPHFLFNTLNNIYSLIAISPDKAQNTVLELSKLLRYALYENNHNFVPLQHEIDFIKNYVELMRIRLTADIEVKSNIEVSSVSNHLVAPMLFISLVENSFKHGISPSHPSFIHITIHELNNQLHCTIRNSCFPKSSADQSGSGIGLDNLRRRLQLIYPSQHTFTAQKEDNTFVAQLIIPLNNAN